MVLNQVTNEGDTGPQPYERLLEGMHMASAKSRHSYAVQDILELMDSSTPCREPHVFSCGIDHKDHVGQSLFDSMSNL